MKLFSNTFSVLENGLDYSSLKQKVVSQNIANVDTPKYKAKDASFKGVLQAAMNKSIEANRTDERHFEFKQNYLQPAVTTRKNVQYNHNGNSVDLDKEMAELASNQIYYNAVTDRLNGKFSSLLNVVKGGK